MNKALEFYHGERSDGHTHFDGHTEIYATYTNTKKYTMMLAHHDLRVVHVSTHVSLREACDRVKKDRVLEVIEIADQACKDLGIQKPRMSSASLSTMSGITAGSFTASCRRPWTWRKPVPSRTSVSTFSPP